MAYKAVVYEIVILLINFRNDASLTKSWARSHDAKIVPILGDGNCGYSLYCLLLGYDCKK
jgi:hypothetical protein